MTITYVSDISAAFQSALTADHQIATLAEVWSGGALAVTLPIDPQSSVTVDRTAAIRRRCSVNLTDSDGTLTPASARDLLAPYGNEVRLYRGITYPNGDQELARQGVFRIEETDIADNGDDLKLTVVGMDRSRSVQQAGFADVYSVPKNQNLGAAIQNLLSSLSPGFTLTYAFAPTSFTTPNAPSVYKPGDDPLQACQDLAKAAGMEFFFDVSGNAVLQPVVDPITAPVSWNYDEGSVNIATSLTRSLTRANAANYVIRDGQSSGHTAPVRGIASDTNPASGTYIGGTYGRVVDYQSSSLITTAAQATAAASAALLLNIGSVEALSLSAVPKPDHDAGDVIEVTRARSKLSNAYYVLDSLTLGFEPSAVLQAQTRRVTR